MNSLLLLLCAFVVLGLFQHRLRGFTYVAMALIIFAYVLYVYSNG